MQELTVTHRNGTYPIKIKSGIRHHLHHYLDTSYSSILIITDHNVEMLYLDDVKKGLKTFDVFEFIIPAGEKSKDIHTYYEALTKAFESGLDRNSLIIALGGGVVGDLAGFVAATFMRGIDYIQVPTTILAHDSSVGGKVAINHEFGKNLIGAFYAPVGVYYDPETLTSLSEREVRSGYAELVKEALIESDTLFQAILKTTLKPVSQASLQDMLLEGIKVKQKIVEEDEHEHGIRMFLNLGHTLAHALEKELGYGEITHGEAVAIGLLFAMHVSENELEISLPFDDLKAWLRTNDYPIQPLEIDSRKIIQHMKADKKAVKQNIKMVLLQEPGRLTVKELEDNKLLNYLETFKERVV